MDKGLGSVCMTISRAIEYTERLLPDPQTAQKMYEEKLEEVRQASRTEKSCKLRSGRDASAALCFFFISP